MRLMRFVATSDGESLASSGVLEEEMSELDLDVLERQAIQHREAFRLAGKNTANVSWPVIVSDLLALIERVRKAEDIIMPFVQAVETAKDVRLQKLKDR